MDNNFDKGYYLRRDLYCIIGLPYLILTIYAYSGALIVLYSET